MKNYLLLFLFLAMNGQNAFGICDFYESGPNAKPRPSPPPALVFDKWEFKSQEACSAKCSGLYNYFRTYSGTFAHEKNNWRCLTIEGCHFAKKREEQLIEGGFTHYCDIYDLEQGSTEEKTRVRVN